MGEIGKHDFQRQGKAVQQFEHLFQIGVLAIFFGVVFEQDAIGKRGGGLPVQAVQFVNIIVEGACCQPVFAAARAEQDQGAAFGQVCQEATQGFLFGLWQGVLDGEVRACDRFQVVQQQQVVLGAQALHEHSLLRCWRERLEVGVVPGAIEGLRDLGHDLLERPGFLVVAEGEDAPHEASGVPPGCQVP